LLGFLNVETAYCFSVIPDGGICLPENLKVVTRAGVRSENDINSIAYDFFIFDFYAIEFF
jgi:hypothetical protein